PRLSYRNSRRKYGSRKCDLRKISVHSSPSHSPPSVVDGSGRSEAFRCQNGESHICTRRGILLLPEESPSPSSINSAGCQLSVRHRGEKRQKETPSSAAR